MNYTESTWVSSHAWLISLPQSGTQGLYIYKKAKEAPSDSKSPVQNLLQAHLGPGYTTAYIQ